MFEGVYPERIKCSAVEEPIVPPPPITTTFVLAREPVMLSKAISVCVVAVFALDSSDPERKMKNRVNVGQILSILVCQKNCGRSLNYEMEGAALIRRQI